MVLQASIRRTAPSRAASLERGPEKIFQFKKQKRYRSRPRFGGRKMNDEHLKGRDE
jgi:hypothetical protein